jgi:excisionase family DNA binding protein
VSNQTPTASDWLTVAQACQVAQVGGKLLYREIKAHRLRAARLGGRRGPIRIHRDWVRAWLEASARPEEI